MEDEGCSFAKAKKGHIVKANLQDHNKNDCLGPSDVWEHPMHLTRLANQDTVDNDSNDSHELHGGLPGANAVDPLAKRPLMNKTELESVTPDFENVVEKGAKASQRVG